MPGGHIFHRDLSWPFAESEHEVGRWGVETTRPNVWVCGAGARRGGGVSGGVSGPGGDAAAYPWRFWLEGEATVSAYRPGTIRRRKPAVRSSGR